MNEMTLDAGTVWMVVSAGLVLLMTPGLALFYGGMTRSKSALNMMMMSFVSMGLVGVVWILWVSGMTGGEGWLGLVGSPLADPGLTTAMEEGGLIAAGFGATFAIITVALISGAVADRARDPADQRVVERRAGDQGDEQRHPVGAVRSVDTEHEGLGDLVERFDDLVDVGRSHPDPVAVQRRVAAAVDHERPTFGHRHPVAVPPDRFLRIRRTALPFVGEISRAVARTVGIVPEAHGHRRHRRGDDEFTHLPHQRAGVGRPTLQCHTEVAHRQLPRDDRYTGGAAGECGHDVGAAADRRDGQSGPDVVVDPGEKICGER